MTRQPMWSCRFSPTPEQLVDELDAVFLEQRAGPDAGKLQQLRRLDRAAGEQHLAPGADATGDAVLGEFEPDRALAVEQDAAGEGVHLDAANVAPLHRRAQIGDRGRAASHLAHGELIGADPLLLGAVEIGVGLVAGLLRGGDKGVVQFVRRAQVGDRQRAVAAVELVGAALLAFGATEIGEHVVIRPPGIAHLAPQVEILALAPDVDQAVDRRRPAQYAPSRPRHPPPAEALPAARSRIAR